MNLPNFQKVAVILSILSLHCTSYRSSMWFCNPGSSVKRPVSCLHVVLHNPISYNNLIVLSTPVARQLHNISCSKSYCILSGVRQLQNPCTCLCIFYSCLCHSRPVLVLLLDAHSRQWTNHGLVAFFTFQAFIYHIS
jgi:hypothetical protein